MFTTVLNTKIREAESKIPNTNNLVTTTVLNTKISEVDNKVPKNSQYITTQEFNKLTTKNFEAMNKTDFDDKLTSFNRKFTSNKIKYLEVQKKLDSLITKDYSFLLGRIYCTSNDGFQNMFIYQPTF